MNEKKVFTEKQIKQALNFIFSELLDDVDFINDDSYVCGYSDALIDVFCYIFDTYSCPINFGVEKENDI